MGDLMGNDKNKPRPKDSEYIYGYDLGSGDMATFIHGYKDKDGKIVITDIKQYE